ncbi:hypothetical protein V5O48_003353 [Marasmius crinis-equi]|uniref:Autophagy-related protein n=1 Tax=Marasmius crinis-equi TaxID=585013 RepID=A0ABR3FT32_9AGAR
MHSVSNFKRKLHGWLSYAFASEVFVIVSLTLFLPICLEQFARDNGYFQSDRTTRCVKNEEMPDGERCVVKIGWFWIDSASFSLYVYSISVALQALTVISVGGIADHPHHRKRLLLSFAFAGAVSAMLFFALPSSSPLWFLSALLAIVANVGFGVSVVAMNAYLPSLARTSPEVVQILDELREAETLEDIPESHDGDEELGSDQPLIQRSHSTKVTDLRARYEAELSRATSRISSMGIALGYAAGICLLIVALIPVTKLKGTTFALRLAIALSGVWWAAFSIPAAIWLPGAGSPTENVEAEAIWTGNTNVPEGKWSIWKELLAAWKRLGGMLRWTEIKRLRNTFKYLAAWFLISDGFTTISSTAILFGKTVLKMEASALIMIGIITPLAGILGSLVWPKLQRRFEWSNLRILVILLVLASLVPAYGCLGFLRVFQESSHFGGLTTQGEMFGLAVYFGFMYGAFQGYARASYAELIPPGEEARWYALFSITDKSSSFVGPLIVGLISDLTGNIRYSFFFLYFMIMLSRTRRGPLPLPPGPKKLPLIGNLLDMPKKYEWETYDRWCRELDSDIIHLEVAGTSIVVMNSTDVAEDLLDKHSAIHSNRPRLVMVNELMGWDYTFGLMEYGDEWLVLPSGWLIWTQEFHPTAAERFQPLEVQKTHAFLRRLLDDPDNFSAHIRHLAASTILGIAYGIDVLSENDPYVAAAERALESLGLGIAPGAFLVESIPLLKHVPGWFPGAGFKRKAKEWAGFSTVMREMPFQATLAKIGDGTATPSFMSYSLEKLDTTADKAKQEQLIKSVAATMYTGGTDSTFGALSTFILAMLANPEAQKRAQSEIDSTVPSGELPRFSDEQDLPFVSAIVKEVYRWQPVTPLGIPHASVAEDEYRGYRIPSGSIMVPNIWAMLHDENTYPDPYSFKPERFIGADGKLDLAVKDPASILFGFGRRICPGRHMSWHSIWICVASMLASFDISKAVDENGNTIEPTYEYVSSLACIPAPFRCTIKPRSRAAEDMIKGTGL